MKKVGKYLIITLLLLLGLCCVGVLYLFFIPNSELFNITYINNNKLVKSELYSSSDVSKIEINSRAYDVNILTTESEKISLELYSNSFGFVLTKQKNSTISENLKDNILSFNVNESYGFATKNNSYINLYLPENTTIDLVLNNKKAETTINAETIKIKNLSYSTESGDISIKNCELTNEINLNLNKADCNITGLVKTNTTNPNNVNLKLTTGKFHAEKSSFGDINILKNERGIISVKQCNMLVQNTNVAGGQIYAETVSHLNVSSSDTEIVVANVLDGAIIDMSGSGSVKIDSLNGSSSIITNSGNIAIANCESSSSFHTDSGNITVNNAKKTISIKTNYGDAVVNFKNDASAPHYSESELDKSRTLYATIYNGKLTATGVEHIGVANPESNSITGITVTGNGRVFLNMSDVCGENAIVGKNGEVSIVVNHESIYKLTTNPNPTSGNVRVNLMQITQYNGYTTQTKRETFVNCKEASYDGVNSLTVSTTTGDLTIVDTKLI